MIKNANVKKIFKCTISPILSWFNRFIPKEQHIVFLYTANKGICYSLIPLRKYLLDYHFDKKYRIFCGIENLKYAEIEPRVTFVAGFRAILVFLRAGHVFYSAGQLPIKPSKGQRVFHLRHGNANYKRAIDNGYEFYFTHMIAPSDYYVPIMVKEYGCKEDNILVAGDPMCDILLSAPKDKYDFKKYSKILFWVPTFRQSDQLGQDDSHLESLVPLFKEEDYQELNDKLSKYNIYLIVKLHPMQTVADRTLRYFSHLSVFSHKEFCESEYDMYTLMAQSDGLIGDYSSASMQYLLLNRPIAYVVPDIDDYARTRGFVFEHPEDYMGGHIIKEKKEFFRFLEDFANNKDIYRDKRQWVCSQIYKYKDANSCERILKLNGVTQ